MDDVEMYMNNETLNDVLDKFHRYEIFQTKSDGRWRSYLPDPNAKNGRRQIAKKTRAALKEALYRFYIENQSLSFGGDITLARLYPEWLEYKALETNRQGTIVRINAAWKRYYAGTDIVHRPIKKLDYITLHEWALRLVGNQCDMTKKEYYNCSIIMRQCLEYAYEKGYIERNPFARVKISGKKFRRVVKKPASTEVFFESEEYAIKEYAWMCFKNNRHFHQKLTPLAILFLFQTGLRVGEICALKYSDIIDDGNAILVSHMLLQGTKEVVDQTKGVYGDRLILLTDEAKMLIDETIKAKGSTVYTSKPFVFSMTDLPLGYSTIKNVLYKYCDEIGIQRKSPHKIRKTVATILRQEMPLESVQAMFGHVDGLVTDFHYTYDRMQFGHKRQIMNAALSSKSPRYN